MGMLDITISLKFSLAYQVSVILHGGNHRHWNHVRSRGGATINILVYWESLMPADLLVKT